MISRRVCEKENKQLKKELAIYKPKELTPMQEIKEEVSKEKKIKDFFDKKRKEKEQNKNRLKDI